MSLSDKSKSRRAKSVGRAEDAYPSPFFDVASNYLPKTIKETFNWCLYYQQTNPIINAVTSKLATYPITDLVFESENPGLVKTLKDIFESKFNIRTFLVETNLDRYTYGNSFTSVAFPIKKMLKCKACGQEVSAKKTSYIWKNYTFQLECKSCGHTGSAEVRDEPIKSAGLIKLIRWNPNHINIRTNEVTGSTTYYYNIPGPLKNSITLGKPDIVEELPQAFIDAVKNKKAIKFQRGKIFHSKRPGASRDPQDSGWGTPLILPVLKDVFFLQILRKSQEAVAMEHIVPMRVLFPQITTDGSNPYQHINLKDWQSEVLGQIQKWRKDTNHIPVMPVPIGQQAIGGQGRALLLHQEIRIYSEQIIAGMGVPTGFFYGEAQYSGASVNLRALENEFLGNRDDMLKLVHFIADQVYAFLALPKSGLSFKPFKMADDLQRASFDLSLVQANMLSSKTFMQSRNYDYSGEQTNIVSEQSDKSKVNEIMSKSQAEAQGEGLLIQTKYQIKAQELQQQMAPQAGQEQPGPPEEVPPEEGAAPENVEEMYQQAVSGGAQEGAPPENVEEMYQQAVGGEQEGAAPENVEEMYQQAVSVGDEKPGALGDAQSPMNIEISRAGGAGVALQEQAAAMVKELVETDRVTRYKVLTKLKKLNPPLYYLVNQHLNQVSPPKVFKMPTSSGS
jgi:hypothetical protein